MLKTLKDFFDFCGGEDKKKLKLAVLFGVLKAFFAAFKIGAVYVIAEGIVENDMTKDRIFLSLGIMAGSMLGQFLVGLKLTMLQTESGYHSCAFKRIEIAEHLRYLPMGFFNKNSLGSITNVTTNTLEAMADVAVMVVMIVTQGIITTGVITVWVFAFEWRIGLILLAGVVLFAFFNSLMQKATKKVAPRKHKADEAIVSSVIDYVQGIAEVKNYNMTAKTAKTLEHDINEKTASDTRLELTVIPHFLLQNLTTKFTGVVMCAASTLLYFDGKMALSYAIVMMVASFMVYESLDLMGGFSALIRNIDISMKKTKEIMEMPSMETTGESIVPENLDIELKNVSFSYDKRKIIDGVSLKIPQKTTTAVVGPSGGGKTTLCNLMARFWDVNSGEVLLGGKNVKDYSFDSLMRNFSFVFQRVYLFKDTIANNIRFGEPEASMERVMEAAKKARCHDFILQLPDGYDTIIGEGGASLSGGEKQRISIARAILKDSPIIILDEATANVDPENEAELSLAIEELTREKTIIMIAHRLKTVRKADQIFVIDDGRIAQHGTHEELMSQKGIYKTFVEERKEAASWKIA
ncbi:MAG: ABC transporter ATP-binding protein [Lachnospiraceae bacterium]|nr:ABC transporter ATP-binding protein [Lachnospiraceae bacterium]